MSDQQGKATGQDGGGTTQSSTGSTLVTPTIQGSITQPGMNQAPQGVTATPQNQQHQIPIQAANPTPIPTPTPGAMPAPPPATPQPMQPHQGVTHMMVPQGPPGAPLPPGATIRSNLPQVSLSQMPGVQVIQQPLHSPPYLNPFYSQPQFQMLQNTAAVQAMQLGGMNPQMGLAVQGRPPSVGPKSPGMIAAVPPGSQVQMKPPVNTASSPTPANTTNKNAVNSKPGTPAPTTLQQQQASAMMGGKPILQRPSSQPVVIGQVGMIPNQVGSSQSLMVAQPKSPIVSMAPSSQQQMINGAQQLRFTTQPTFVTNNGQIITGTQPTIVGNLGHLQAMATLATQNMQIPQQQMPATLAPALLGSQPLYIRAAAPGQIQAQQNIMGTVQPAQPIQPAPVATVKGKVDPNPPPVRVTMAQKQAANQQNPRPARGAATILPASPKTNSHPGYERMAHVQPSVPATTKQGSHVVQKQVNKVKARSHTKIASPAPLVNGSTGSTNQSKTTPQSSLPPPLLVPIPPKQQQSDTKPEERKASPPTLEPVTTKSESTRKSGHGHAAAKRDSSAVKQKPASHGKKEKEGSTEKEAKKKEVVPPPATPSGPVERQKAIVKPQILTHVIEGFVIQEGPEPFAVQRSSVLTEFMSQRNAQNHHQNDIDLEKDAMCEPMQDETAPQEEPDASQPATQEAPMDHEEAVVKEPAPVLLKCEYCNKLAKAGRFRGSKRFCSTVCAKRYNVSCTRRFAFYKSHGIHQSKHMRKRPCPSTDRRAWKRGSGGRLAGERSPTRYMQLSGVQTPVINEEEQNKSSTSDTTSTSQEESSEPQSPAPPTPEAETTQDAPRAPPQAWTVQDVVDFIRSMPDCAAFADNFRQQEIDGQALMLLKEDHLMSAMNMKLGPALKICEKIRKIKGEIP